MRRESVKIWKKRGMALALSLVMLLGSGLAALAAANYDISNLPSLGNDRMLVHPGDTVHGVQSTDVGAASGERDSFDVEIDGVKDASSTPTSTTINGTYWAETYQVDVGGGSSAKRYVLKLTTYVPESKPVSDGGTEEPSKTQNSYSHRHAHSYRVVIEPTETEDGLGQSRCDCGDVEWEQVIPSGLAWVKNILSKIENAEENGVVEIETSIYSCYTKKIIEALQKRPDVTLKTVYTDKEGNRKGFTIPAGQTPTDGADFYGFTYLGNLYGWDEQD